MRSRLLEILADVRPDVDFEVETQLITDGILESFDIVTLVGELEDEFDIKIRPKDLVPENFNSVEQMQEMISRLEEE